MELWLIVAAFLVLLLTLERQRRTRRRLERLAITDPLTGLPNRNHLGSILSSAMTAARRQGTLLALVLVDLDHFKDVNDSLGHATGDEALREVAERLRTFSPESYPVVRIGGDEFALLLHPISNQEDLLPRVRRLAQAFEPPFYLGSNQVYLASSIGVATYPRDASDAEELLDNADWALYRAKRERGNSFQVFRPSMAAWVKQRLELEKELEAALDCDQLHLEFQPQVAVRDGRIVGIEALARWRHPQRGNIAPSTFIPLAEETGRIPALGDWVTRRACQIGAQWLRAGGAPLPLSVNVSIGQIQSGSLIATVEDALAASSLPAHLLRLEITANQTARHIDKVHECLSQLTELGVTFAIDDFGTGYGSLDHLLRYPVSALKIHRTFIAGVPEDRTCSTIVSAAAMLGRGIGLQVIAEGVEASSQLQFLRAAGCDVAQGYLLCPPLPQDELAAILHAGRIDVSFPMLQGGGAGGAG